MNGPHAATRRGLAQRLLRSKSNIRQNRLLPAIPRKTGPIRSCLISFTFYSTFSPDTIVAFRLLP
jgi:hypothetical protein